MRIQSRTRSIDARWSDWVDRDPETISQNLVDELRRWVAQEAHPQSRNLIDERARPMVDGITIDGEGIFVRYRNSTGTQYRALQDQHTTRQGE